MSGIADEDESLADSQWRTGSAISWALLMGTSLLVIVVLAVIAGQRRNLIEPKYVGQWTLSFSDGTTQFVSFNPDGTISANDNQVYRWTATPEAVDIDTREKPIVDLKRPGSVVKYLFPNRGHVVLHPKYSNDGKDVSLIGDAVELRR